MAQNFRAGGHFAPAKEVEPLFFADDLKQLFVLVAVQLFLWEKEHANAVVTLVAQRNAGFFGSFFEELVADLQQDTDTIAGFAFGILTGTVFQVLHDLQSIVDRLWVLRPLISTTAPMPQLSCSNRGSYSPAGALRSVKFSIRFLLLPVISCGAGRERTFPTLA